MTDFIFNERELINEIVEVLAGNPDGLRVKQLDQIVADNLKLSTEDRSKMRVNGRSEFAYRMAWARTRAKKNKLIAKSSNGVYLLLEPLNNKELRK
jgi:restriction endonuclease Mrr